MIYILIINFFGPSLNKSNSLQAIEINNNNVRLFFFNKFILIEINSKYVYIFYVFINLFYLFLTDAKILELEKIMTHPYIILVRRFKFILEYFIKF